MAISAVAQLSVPQTTPIEIRDNSTANPYPSVIDLREAHLVGTLEKVTVTLNGVTHPYANDIGVVLVGPSGKGVRLVQNAGAGLALNAASLTFGDGGTALSSGTPLTAGGTFAPLAGTLSLPPGGTAPTATYLASLQALATDNSNPNGEWKLYVVDDQVPYSGSIASWSLNLYTTPTVAVVTNTTGVTNESGQIRLTMPQFGVEPSSYTLNLQLADSSTAADALKVTATTGDGTKIATTNLVAGGTGANRTLTVTPISNAVGNASFTITVDDGVATVSTNINVTLTAVDQPPVISLNTNGVTTVAGVMSTNVVATVGDPDNAAGTLHLTATSSDANIVAPTGVFFGAIDPGTGRAMFTVVPKGNVTGTAVLTIRVDDGTRTNSTALNVTVNGSGHPTFANASPIALSASGAANSTIGVSGVPGKIGRVTVSVVGLSNYIANTSSLKLKGPDNTEVILLPTGNTGLGTPTTFGMLTFADAGGSALVAAGSITNLTLTPNQALSAFAGKDPNVTWTLTVENGGANAQVLGGWVLNLYMAPTISGLPEVVRVPEETESTINFTVADVNGKVSGVTASIPGNAGLATLTPTLADNKTDVSLKIKGNTLQFGTNNVNVVVTDENGFTTTGTFSLEVPFVNHLPTISFIDRQVTSAARPILGVPFSVDDADQESASPFTQSVLVRQDKIVSDNQKLLPNANIVLNNLGSDNYSLDLYPVGVTSGSANVTVTVTDGITEVSRTFQVFIDVPANPLFATTSSINIPADGLATPSTNRVSGLVGKVADVSVTLLGLSHQTPSKLHIMLMSPRGTNVVLMAGRGDAVEVNNSTLIFTNSTTVPDIGGSSGDSALITGIYHPAGATTVFPGEAPKTPEYTVNLGAFAGANEDPNGDWVLWVWDETSAKGGTIAGGWELSIQTRPALSVPSKIQLTQENTPITVTVGVGDTQPGANITVEATAAAAPFTSVVVESPVAVSGTGSTRTLTINPIRWQFGTNTINVTATDTRGNTSTASFEVGVQFVNQPPVISTIPNTNTPAATEMIPVEFTVWDPKNNSVTLTASAANTALIPSVTISGPTAGTDHTNIYTLKVLPAGVQTGTTTITVTATDDANKQKSSTSFELTVTPILASANPTAIHIPEGLPVAGAATPYPSVISVKGVGGLVSDVRVALVGFTHPFAHDVNVLLVNPDNSKAVVLMAHAAAGGSADNVRLTFSDAATADIPANGSLTSGDYRPHDYSGSVVFPSPAPARSGYSFNLSAFDGTTPNGDWKLYVLDDAFPDSGDITGGWILYLQTGPAIEPIAAQTTTENTPISIPLTLSDSSVNPSNLTVSVAFTGQRPANLVTDGYQFTGFGANRTLIILPQTNYPSAANLSLEAGTNLVTVTVTDPDNHLTVSTSFPLTVLAVNQAPVAYTAVDTNNYYMDERTPSVPNTKDIVWTVRDPDSFLYPSNIVVTSSNEALVANSNITFTAFQASNPAYPNTNVTVTIKPTDYYYGTAQISFVVSDNDKKATNVVNLVVAHVAQQPTITSIPEQTVLAGTSSTNIEFTVNTPELEVKPSNLVVWAVSDSAKQNVVPNGNIVVGALTDTKRFVKITPVTQVPSDTFSDITVYVADTANKTTNSTTFRFNVKVGPTTQFANTSPIEIKGDAVKPTTYPSIINVSGLPAGAAIHKVTVLLDGFNHTAPADLNALLVSPGGQNVMLMSGAGGGAAVSNLRLTFDDNGKPLPKDSLTTDIYQPGNFTGLPLPANAPTNYPTQYGSTLSVFKGSTAVNGDWKLYISSKAGDTFTLASGWSLTIVVAPTITLASGTPNPLVMNENATATVGFKIGDLSTPLADLQLTAESTNPGLVPTRNVTFSAPDSQGNVTATITPAPQQSGSNYLTLTVTRRSDNASATVAVPMNVTPVNDPGTVSRLSDFTMAQDTTSTVTFVLTDPDTSLLNYEIIATSSDETVITNRGLSFFGSGTNHVYGVQENNGPGSSLVSLDITPLPLKNGSSTITLTFIDPMAIPSGTNTFTRSFKVTVENVNYAPEISAINPQTVASGGSTAEIPFTVTDRNPGQTMEVTAASSDTALIPNGNIVVTPATGTATARTVKVTAAAGTQGGTAQVTLTVKDNGNPVLSSSTTFKVTVRPPIDRFYTNSTPIAINDNTTANPYPSTIHVEGLAGRLSKVAATLNGFSHTYPADVAVMLVSPAGQQLVLMNRVGSLPGGASAVGGLTLTFDDAAETAIPANQKLVSGRYDVNNNDAAYNFPAPAPTDHAVYTNGFASMNGGTPNGDWKLYVVDRAAGDVGSISNGWTLDIVTAPVVVGVQDLVSDQGVPARGNFTIADDTQNTPSYTFSATSSNQGVVTNEGVIFTGGGTNWTVTVNPKADAFGESTINVTGVNGDGQTVTFSFKATFRKVVVPPTINQVADQTAQAGSVALIPITYGNVGVPKADLIVSFQSSNPALVPTSNIQLSADLSQIIIAPVGNLTGSAVITVTVAQPASVGTGTASMSFKLNVVAPVNPVFANTSAITIRDNNTASPYPSTVTVSNVGGTITKATVTIAGLQHSFPSDINMLLVSPAGQKVVLMSRAGQGAPISNVRLTFDDTAAGQLPQFAKITDGVYQPTDYKVTDSYPTPAPAAPYSRTLSVLNGTNPNGDWQLYVYDDQTPDAGQIAQGWSVTIETSGTPPTIAGLTDITTPANARAVVNFTVSDAQVFASNIVVTASSSDPALGTIELGGTDTNRSLTFRPSGSLGEAIITVSANNGSKTANSSFKVTVTAAPIPPTIGDISNQSTIENRDIAVPFTVTSIGASNLTVNASTDNTNIVSDITVTNLGSDYTAVIHLVQYANDDLFGPARITISATNEFGFATNSFVLSVHNVEFEPSFGPIANISEMANATIRIPLSVSDPDTALSNLLFSATSSNPALVKNVTFDVTASTVTASVNLMRDQVGTSTETITVSDGINTTNQTFTVTIVAPPAPAVEQLANQSTIENQNLVLNFVVTNAAGADVTARSDNPNLVSSIAITGSGTNYTATIALVPYANSEEKNPANITITATNAFGSSSTTFRLNVHNREFAPEFGPIADRTNAATASVNIPLTVSDPDTAIGDLVFFGSSDNSTLVSNVTFTVEGTNVTAHVNLVSGQTGSANVTITATDGINMVPRTFKLTITQEVVKQPVTITATASGGVQLSFTGAPNAQYIIQSSSNLSTWTDVTTITADANGAASYVAQVSAANPALFYRVLAK